jgi:hypothetical protein
MEEFRYYEAIKRQRQNQTLIIELSNKFGETDVDFGLIIDKCAFGENPNKLRDKETISVIEASKSINQEADLMDKAVEIIKAIKK